jgi:hypothetical protein
MEVTVDRGFSVFVVIKGGNNEQFTGGGDIIHSGASR